MVQPIFLNNNSTAIFDNNSIVTFNDNVADNGTIYSKICSNVIFRAACEGHIPKVTWLHNTVLLFIPMTTHKLYLKEIQELALILMQYLPVMHTYNMVELCF